MYYHCAILLLFRPFIKLRFIGSSVLPRDVCSQAAEAITTLVRSYDHLYTLQRTPSFVPYLVLASSIIHLVVSNTQAGQQQLRQCTTDLKDMCNCHGFAKRGLNILRILNDHWGIGAYNTLLDGEFEGDDLKAGEEDVPQLCRPISASMNLFCPNMSDSLLEVGPDGASTLFAPFPLQGMPMLAADEMLERDGFTRLY
jgi:hypothetical protein